MTASKTPYHHGDLHSALLDAAEKLLENKGVSGVTLRETARQAGVSHTAPYRHFADKTALLVALATTGYARLTREMEKCVTLHPNDPLAQLREASLRYVILATRHPQMTSLMFGGFITPEDYDEDLSTTASSAFEGLLNIIRNGLAADLYIETDPMDLALLAWSTVHGFSMLCSSGHLQSVCPTEEDIRHYAEKLGGMLLTGMQRQNLGNS